MKNLETAHISGQMEMNMLAIGKMMKDQEMAYLLGQMAKNMLEILRKTK